uniref:NYN domain-containing protein n=1 Tax=Clostridium sp. NkU-1 TaxID=1095009 RepID=UPI00326169CD
MCYVTTRAIKKCNVILVFDGYKVKGNPGTVMEYHNIHVIFTKEAETADQYIEKNLPANRQAVSGTGCHFGQTGTDYHPGKRLHTPLRQGF